MAPWAATDAKAMMMQPSAALLFEENPEDVTLRESAWRAITTGRVLIHLSGLLAFISAILIAALLIAALLNQVMREFR